MLFAGKKRGPGDPTALVERYDVENSFSWVLLCLPGAGIDYLKAAVRMSNQLKIISRIGVLRVGKEPHPHVVRGAALVRVMQLPEVFEAW